MRPTQSGGGQKPPRLLGPPPHPDQVPVFLWQPVPSVRSLPSPPASTKPLPAVPMATQATSLPDT